MFVFLSYYLFAQVTIKQYEQPASSTVDESEGLDIPFTLIESVPVFKGCEEEKDKRDCFQKKIQEHIKKNLKIPEQALEEGIQGKVIVSFVVEKDGTVNIKNIRGPHPILEKEARRIIEKNTKIETWQT